MVTYSVTFIIVTHSHMAILTCLTDIHSLGHSNFYMSHKISIKQSIKYIWKI